MFTNFCMENIFIKLVAHILFVVYPFAACFLNNLFSAIFILYIYLFSTTCVCFYIKKNILWFTHIEIIFKMKLKLLLYFFSNGSPAFIFLSHSFHLSFKENRKSMNIMDIPFFPKGRNFCALRAEKVIFGDPCPRNIHKYLSVTYACG